MEREGLKKEKKRKKENVKRVEGEMVHSRNGERENVRESGGEDERDGEVEKQKVCVFVWVGGLENGTDREQGMEKERVIERKRGRESAGGGRGEKIKRATERESERATKKGREKEKEREREGERK